MIRKQFFMSPKQVSMLESLTNASVSEHIRRAIDEYIERLTMRKTAASASKKGGQNGYIKNKEIPSA